MLKKEENCLKCGAPLPKDLAEFCNIECMRLYWENYDWNKGENKR